MNRIDGRYLWVFILGMAFFFSGCRQKQNIPLPQDESEFQDPESQPLKWSAPEPINWEPPQSGNDQPPLVKRVDFGRLPSRKINSGSFQPFPKPIPERKFDWKTLPDSAIAWDKLPKTEIETEIYVLPEPETVPVTPPRIRPEELSGIAYIGLNEGLPAARIDDVVQDAAGIIWFINEGKLFRYDGNVVQKYSLQGNPELISISFDRQGLLWLGCDARNGLFVVDTKSKIQWHVNIPSSVFTVHQDRNGLFWIGTLWKGVYVLEWSKRTARQLLFAPETNITKAVNSVFSFYEDREGSTWVATSGGIKIITAAHDKVISIQQKDGLHTNNVFTLMPDSKGRIWVGSHSSPGLSIIYPDEGRIQSPGQLISLTKPLISVLEAADSSLYIPSDSVIYVIDPKLTAFKTIETNASYRSSIWYGHATIDKSGQLWIGTINNGLQLIDTKQDQPVHLNKSRGLGGDVVSGLLEDHLQRLWIGLQWNFPEKTGRVNMLDHRSGRIVDFTPLLDTPIVNMPAAMEDRQHRIWLDIYGKGVYILDFNTNTISTLAQAQGLLPWGSAICQDSRSRIWLGRDNGLVLVDSNLQIIQQYTEFAKGKESSVIAIAEDNRHQVWVATLGNGIFRIDSTTQNIQHIGVENGLSGPIVQGLSIDAEGRAWVATVKGVYIIDDKAEKIFTITTSQGLANQSAYSITKLKDLMAVGTAKGLTIFSTNKPAGDSGNAFKLGARSFGRNQGLAYIDANATSSTALQDGRLAFGVDYKVLSIFDPNVSDTNTNPVYLTSIVLDGKPLVVSDNSAVAVQLYDKDSLRDEATGAVYTNAKLPADTEYYRRKDIQWEGFTGNYNLPINLRLNYDQNYLQFQYAGMHYRDRDKLRYRYILDGADRKWSEFTDKQVTEPYRDLAPGKYTFRVAAITSNGRWSESEPFSFTILPPWWKTGWAYLLYGIVVVTAISTLVRFRSRQLKRKNQLLEERIRLRTSELQESLAELKNTQSQLIQAEKMASLGELTAGIAHEIKNPLNFVNNFAEINKELAEELNQEIEKENYREVKEIALDIMENADKIMHHGKRADDIVKGMLQHSRSSTGIKEPTDINKLADEYLRLAYHGLRAKEKTFNATLKTDFDESIGLVRVMSQDMGRVILNLITNAFYAVDTKKKSLPDGYEPTVIVATKKKGQTVEIAVKDNGSGIPAKIMDKIFQPFFTTKPTGHGTGLGLSLSYDIVKAHGGDMKVESLEGVGTTFIIQLPLT